LLHLVAVMVAVAVAGEELLPTQGAGGLLTRAAAAAAIPAILWMTGFALPQERDRLRALVARATRRGAAGEPA
jgi:hypothetical protein